MSSATANPLPGPVRPLSPTARLVYLVLDQSPDPLTEEEIVERTGAGGRTVNRAIRDLRTNGVVKSRPDPDMRQRYVHTTTR